MTTSSSWLNSLGGLAETAGNLYASIKGQNAATKAQQAAAAAQANQAGQTQRLLIFGGIGLAVVLVIAILFRKS